MKIMKSARTKFYNLNIMLQIQVENITCALKIESNYKTNRLILAVWFA